MPSDNFAQQALAIAAMGFRVVPAGITAEQRHPLVKDWPNRATRSRQQILEWDRQYSLIQPAVAIVVGEQDLWALDCDEPRYLKRPLPRTAIVRSGGGGLHLYFRWNKYARERLGGLGNRYVAGSERDKAIELFTHAHALHAPGSIHYKTGRPYRWHTEMRPQPAPGAWVDYLAALPWNFAPQQRGARGEQKKPGFWNRDMLIACLEAYDCEYVEGSKPNSFYVRCPGREGWRDGTQHSKPTVGLGTKTMVWIENGWPCFTCLHTHCRETQKKTWRDFANHHDPLRLHFDPHRWIEQQVRATAKAFGKKVRRGH